MGPTGMHTKYYDIFFGRGVCLKMGYTKSRAVLVKILVPTINRSRFFKAMRSTHQPTHPRDMIWVTFGIFIELMFPTAVFAGFQALGLGLVHHGSPESTRGLEPSKKQTLQLPNFQPTSPMFLGRQ